MNNKNIKKNTTKKAVTKKNNVNKKATNKKPNSGFKSIFTKPKKAIPSLDNTTELENVAVNNTPTADLFKPVKPKFSFFTKKDKKLDTGYLIIIFILLSCGLLLVFSASYATALYRFNDSYKYISKQIIFVIVGIIAMFIISKIDYRIYGAKKMPYIIYSIGIILLIVVLFMKPISNSRRWIYLPFEQTFQPSEVMKFALIVLFAMLIQKYYKKMHTFTIGFGMFMLYLAPVVVLLMLETHLSATILTCGIAVILMFIGGTRIRYFVFVFIPLGIALLGGIIYVKGVDYIVGRINGWLNPLADISDSTWQTVQSLIAIGSGGLMGKGFGNSVQKYMYLPEPQNDFIFAIWCEEMGFVGAVMLIIVFVLLTTRGIKIATKAPDKFGFFLAIGITAQIALQVIANIAVVTNTFPNTGISLPFFSYGGTALMIQLAEIGVLLNISRHSLEKKT